MGKFKGTWHQSLKKNRMRDLYGVWAPVRVKSIVWKKRWEF